MMQKKACVRFIDIVTYVLDLYIGAALSMSCSGISGGKCQRQEPLAVYRSPVIPEALVDLYGSGYCCFLSVTHFAAKCHPLEGPQAQGRILWLRHTFKGYESWQRRCPPPGARPFLQNDNYGDTMHSYCVPIITFKASGGTRPADSTLALKK